MTVPLAKATPCSTPWRSANRCSKPAGDGAVGQRPGHQHPPAAVWRDGERPGPLRIPHKNLCSFSVIASGYDSACGIVSGAGDGGYDRHGRPPRTDYASVGTLEYVTH